MDECEFQLLRDISEYNQRLYTYTVFGITISWMSVSLNYDETLTANEYNQRLYICTVFGITVWWMSESLNADET